MRKLSLVLTNCLSLKELDLSINPLGDEGIATVISNGMFYESSISFLGLASIGLSSFGFATVLEALQGFVEDTEDIAMSDTTKIYHECSLREIDLSCNQIKHINHERWHLFNASNWNVQRLDLCYNQIATKSCDVLQKSFSTKGKGRSMRIIQQKQSSSSSDFAYTFSSVQRKYISKMMKSKVKSSQADGKWNWLCFSSKGQGQVAPERTVKFRQISSSMNSHCACKSLSRSIYFMDRSRELAFAFNYTTLYKSRVVIRPQLGWPLLERSHTERASFNSI